MPIENYLEYYFSLLRLSDVSSAFIQILLEVTNNTMSSKAIKICLKGGGFYGCSINEFDIGLSRRLRKNQANLYEKQ